MTSLNPSLVGPQGPGRDLLCPFPKSVTDIAGWERFVSRYSGFLARCVQRGFCLAGESYYPEDVEDMVQTLYARLLDDGGRRLHGFRGTTEQELLAYLRSMAFRLVTDAKRLARAEKRGGNLSFRTLRDLEGQGRPSIDGKPSPEDRVLTREGCKMAIRVALPAKLDQARQGLHLLYLSLVEGRTSKEIARTWGKAFEPSSVDSSMYRMRQRLASSSLSLEEFQRPEIRATPSPS